MSAVDAVLAEGFVDPDQLYVTGGSGGGVLTAWIVGKTDRFRAAVVAKPVINWTSFVLTADNAPYFTRYWFPEPCPGRIRSITGSARRCPWSATCARRRCC
jgi:acetyl esterase/lipase